MSKPNFDLVGNETAPNIPPSPTGVPNAAAQMRGTEPWVLDPLQAVQRQARRANTLAIAALLFSAASTFFLFKSVGKVGASVDGKIKEGVRRGLEDTQKNDQTQIQDALSASEKATGEAIEAAKKDLTTVHQADVQAILYRLDQMEKARTIASTTKSGGKKAKGKKHKH
jgi:hypothetical protein